MAALLQNATVTSSEESSPVAILWTRSSAVYFSVISNSRGESKPDSCATFRVIREPSFEVPAPTSCGILDSGMIQAFGIAARWMLRCCSASCCQEAMVESIQSRVVIGSCRPLYQKRRRSHYKEVPVSYRLVSHLKGPFGKCSRVFLISRTDICGHDLGYRRLERRLSAAQLLPKYG
jgi:hypothetical protein